MAEKKPKLLRRQVRSTAAYTLVDLSDLHPDLRKDIIEDAHEGGGTYGIRVVEESVNGPARAPIYGYYNDGPDAERWANAKKEVGIEGAEIPDDEVYNASGASGIEVTDPAREAALRQQAEERAAAEAAAARSAEDAEVSAITGDTDGEDNGNADRSVRVPLQSHHANIVDETLAADATNEAGDAQNRTLKESKTGDEATGAKKRKSKTPR